MAREVFRAALLACAIVSSPALADDDRPAPVEAATLVDKPAPTEAANLVKQANAPISSILQLRFLETYQPEFDEVDGDGNVFAVSITMPFPKYRLLPLPQLSLLTIPAAVSPPQGETGFGDLRFVDIALFDPGRQVLVGVGPTLVFPTASEDRTGQEKWQAGPAAAVAYAPRRWLVGFLAQNPISFAGDDDRAEVNALFLQPFVTYQLGNGWFVRSIPQIAFNWETHNEVVPVDLGAGRVFEVGGQLVSCFIEPFWNVVHSEPGPSYGIGFGVGLLYPGFWGS